MPSLGELTVLLGAVTGPFKQDLSEARSELVKTDNTMKTVVSAAGKLGIAVVAAGAAIVTGLVKSGLQAIDTQVKQARAINATADGLRALQIVTDDFGVEQGELNSAMEKLTQRLGEAQRQGGTTADMLKNLGLSAKQLSEMDVDERMAAIADRVHELGLSTSQTSDVLRELGIRSAALVDVMRQGGDGIRGARQEVEQYGLSLSQVDARQVEAAGDAIARIGRVFESIRNHVTVALAPIIAELADRFNEAAKANKGFGEVARNVVEASIRGFGKVLDVIHGLRVTIKAVELVAKGFGAAFYSVAQMILEVFTKVNDGITFIINDTIRGLNRFGAEIAEIPRMDDSDFMKGIRSFAEQSRNEIGSVREELHALAMQELPSTKFDAFLENVKNRAKEAAEAAEEAQSSLGQGNEGFGAEEDTTEADKKAKELEALKEQLNARVEAIEQSLMDEEGLQQDKYLRDLEALTQAREMELLTKEQYNILEQELEADHMDKIKEIREKSMTDMQKFMAMSFSKQAATVLQGLGNMTAGVAQHSKTLFNLNKAAGIGQATVAMFQGIAEGLKLGWPMAIPAVAYAAAQGAAAITGIKSATFGGGSAAPPPSAAAPAPATGSGGGGSSGSGGGDQQTVRIQGLDPSQLFSGRQVVDLLNSAVKDGAKLVLE